MDPVIVDFGKGTLKIVQDIEVHSVYDSTILVWNGEELMVGSIVSDPIGLLLNLLTQLEKLEDILEDEQLYRVRDKESFEFLGYVSYNKKIHMIDVIHLERDTRGIKVCCNPIEFKEEQRVLMNQIKVLVDYD